MFKNAVHVRVYFIMYSKVNYVCKTLHVLYAPILIDINYPKELVLFKFETCI